MKTTFPQLLLQHATQRPQSGKGPSHRLRREGKIPAIAYGRGLPATPLAVSPKGLLEVLKSDHGQNAVVELDIEGGEKMTVMVRDYSYHPLTRELEHADFMRVKLDEPVNVEIPFRCVGKSKGIILGGVLQLVAQGHLEARAHQFGEVGLHGVRRHPRHRDRRACRLTALGQRDIQ